MGFLRKKGSSPQQGMPTVVDGEFAEALRAANADLAEMPGGLRAVAYRTAYGETEVAIVVPGENLYEALDPLSPAPIREVLGRTFSFTGQEVVGRYMTASGWADDRHNGWRAP